MRTNLVVMLLVLAGVSAARAQSAMFGMVQYACGDAPRAAACADFNGDGRTDLVVANSGDSTLTLRFGTSGGMFGPAITLSTGPLPTGVVATDLTGDGRADIAVTCWTDGTLHVFRNAGGGLFAPASVYEAGVTPFAIAAGDMDGDGDLDLVTGSGSSARINVLPNLGAGLFGLMTTYTDLGGQGVALGDIDGDGDLDVAFTNTTTPGSFSVKVRYNSGRGLLSSPLTYANSDNGTGIALADIDADADLDIVVGAAVRRNLGNGLFAARELTGMSCSAIAVGDLNNDGRLDLAGSFASTATLPTSDLQKAMGLAGGTFAAPSLVGCGSRLGEVDAFAVVLADADTDGDLDLIAVNLRQDDVTVMLNAGDGRLGELPTYTTDHSPASVDIGDIDGDGLPDVASAAPTSQLSPVRWLRNLGGSLAPATLITLPVGATSPYDVRVADMDIDGDSDLVVVARGATVGQGFVTVVQNNGAGVLVRGSLVPVAGECTRLVTPDLDADGDPDVVLGRSSAPTRLFFATNAPSGLVVSGPIAALGGDLTEAKISTGIYPDVVDSGNGSVNIISSGPGGTRTVTTLSAPGANGVSTSGDFNGDGRADIAVGRTAGLRVLINTDDGLFPVDSLAGDVSGRMRASDLDRDGDVDLAVLQTATSGVAVLLNDGSAHFELQGVYPVASGPMDIGIADMNADGWADVVVASADSKAHTVLLNRSQPLPPAISDQPDAIDACLRGTAEFSVTARGVGPFFYEWLRDGERISPQANPSAHSARLSLGPLAFADAGVYSCEVTGPGGRVMSGGAALRVCAGDHNCDGRVDGDDLILYFGRWDSAQVQADVNDDGSVDGDDVIEFMEGWDAGC